MLVNIFYFLTFLHVNCVHSNTAWLLRITTVQNDKIPNISLVDCYVVVLHWLKCYADDYHSLTNKINFI